MVKIAVVNEYMLSKGGVERTTLLICKHFKDVHVYTTKYDPEKCFSELENHNITELGCRFYGKPILQQLEFISKMRRLSLSGYDLIVARHDLAKQASMPSGNHPFLFWAAAQPIQTYYDHYRENKENLPFIQRQAFKVWSVTMRRLDAKANSRVDKFLFNSNFTRQRYQEIYGVAGEVLHQPIDLSPFHVSESGGDYFLSVQRLNPQKRIELQLEIFRHLPNERLKIVGGLSHYNRKWYEKLLKIAPPNVEFVGEVEHDELAGYYANCKALIFTGMAEGFPAVVIEAMACGKPVLVVNEGGQAEPITSRTGRVISKPYLKNFIKCIKRFDEFSFDPEDCWANAELYSSDKVLPRFKKIVGELVDGRN